MDNNSPTPDQAADQARLLRPARVRLPLMGALGAAFALALVAPLSGCALFGNSGTLGAPREKTEDAGSTRPSRAERRKGAPASAAEKAAPARGAKAAQAPSATHEPARLRAPLALPSLADAPTLTLEQSIRVRFHEKALAAGAPESVPPLRAMVLVDPRRISAVFTALGLVVWRIDYTEEGLRETRHPKLSEKVEASRMLRDFMFVLWPEESIRRVLPSYARFSSARSAASCRRTLTLDEKPALRAVTTEIDGRSRTTLVNDLEGYTLTIESIR